MAIEKLLTCAELAEKTGRPKSFWLNECRQGRLSYLKTETRGWMVSESDYQDWVEHRRQPAAKTPARATQEEFLEALHQVLDQRPQRRASPAQAYLTKEEQEACLLRMKEAQEQAYAVPAAAYLTPEEQKRCLLEP